MNSRSEDELSLFNISKTRIKKIEMRKQKAGAFKSVDEILELDGFGIKVLEKFCESILKESDIKIQAFNDAKENVATSKRSQFVSPVISDSVRTSISSCVSFHFDLNYLAWTKLVINPENEFDASRPIYVEDWNSHLIDNTEKKLSLSELMQIVLYLNKKIPAADVYTIEAMQSPQGAKQPGSVVQLTFNVQRAQMFSMLSILMASRYSSQFEPVDPFETEEKTKLKNQQRVFFLRNYLSSRLYKTYVGNERVSSEQVIEAILRYNYSKDQPVVHSFAGIDVPMHLRQFYNDLERVERDYLGQSFLNGLTFMKLCVLRCPKTIASLNKRSSN